MSKKVASSFLSRQVIGVVTNVFRNHIASYSYIITVYTFTFEWGVGFTNTAQSSACSCRGHAIDSFVAVHFVSCQHKRQECLLRPIENIPDVFGLLSVSLATVAYMPIKRLASSYISDSVCICQTLITLIESWVLFLTVCFCVCMKLYIILFLVVFVAVGVGAHWTISQSLDKAGTYRS